MNVIKPSVTLINPPMYSQLLNTVELAGRVCYKSEHKITYGSAEEFVRKVIKRGHEAVIEHGSVTIKFVCDRGISHEIVRHRLASYCQESTRYCVAGDTVLSCKNPHNKMTVEDLYKNYSETQNGSWKRLLFKQYNEDTGELIYSRVNRVFKVGVEPCVKIKTRLGYELVCTADHQILTDHGYVPAIELTMGRKVMVNGSSELYQNRDWLWYQNITLNKTFVQIAREFGFNVSTLKKWARKFNLPKKGTGYFRIGHTPWNKGKQIPEQLEALRKYHHCGRRNDKILKEDTTKYQKYRADLCAICGDKEGLHVHHIDENRNNNSPRNLITLCASCHQRVHSRNLEVGYLDSIEDIEFVGDREVYDIEMKSDYHNFVANGVVVHNCNYNNDQFGGEITVIKPCFTNEGYRPYEIWYNACLAAEKAYFDLLDVGWTAQEARSVLPNSLKTEVVMTANIREWRHFIKLRASAKAHPQMREVAEKVKELLRKNYPAFFEDL